MNDDFMEYLQALTDQNVLAFILKLIKFSSGNVLKKDAR